MLTSNALSNRIEELQNIVKSIDNKILDLFPIENITNACKSYHRRHLFFGIRSLLEKSCEHELLNYNPRILTLYYKLSLLFMIRDSKSELEHQNLPPIIKRLYEEWFERVLMNFAALPDDYYRSKNAIFLDDLGVCCLKIIPIGGAWKVEIQRGPPIRHFRENFFQLIDYLIFSFIIVGGFKPFFTIHTLKRYHARFNAEERYKCYLRIAELLKVNPRVRGIYVRGWLYDPRLGEVSPELEYLRRVPHENGAKSFRFKSPPHVINYALMWSPTRRKLYEEGKYMPTEYALIWPRKKLLDWADKQDRINKSEGSIYS